MNKSVALAGLILSIFGIVLLQSHPILPEEEAVIVGVERISPRTYAIAVLIPAVILLVVSIILPRSERTLKMDLSLLGAFQLFLSSLAILWNALLPIHFEPLGMYGIIGIILGVVLLVIVAVLFILGRRA